MNTCKSKVNKSKIIKPQKVVKISFNKLLFIDQELYDKIDALPNILKYRIYIMNALYTIWTYLDMHAL